MKSNGKSTTPIIAANAKKNNGKKPAPPSEGKRTGAKRVSRASSRATAKINCQVLERITDGIVAFDAEMNYIYVNEQAGKILGREPQDLVGKNFLKMYPDVAGRPFLDACQRALETQTVVPFDGYFSPSHTWFEGRVYPSGDGISVLLRESKHQEPPARLSSYNIYDVSQFPEQNPNPVMRFTRDGNLLYANPVSAPLLTAWKGESQHNLPIELQELLFVVSETTANRELELENDGKTYSCLMVPVPESGYVNLYFSDITERKQSQESIDALIHQTITGITRTDMNGRLVFANQSFCEMIGYSESELLGKETWEVNHPEDIAKNKRLFERMITDGEAYQLEKRILRRNGSTLWVTVGTSPLRDASGQIYAAVSVVVDITRRKRAEEALLDNARRTLYLASLSDAIRSLGSPSQIEAEAVRILGLHLKASRVAYATLKPDGTATIRSSYSNGIANWSGAFHLNQYLPGELLAKLRLGRTVVLAEADHDSGNGGLLKLADESVSIRTQVVTPCLREGELVAVMFVQQSEKRDWKNEEIHILEETAERMQVAAERARAEQELRESENRFRILSNTVPSMVWSTAPDGTVQYLNEYWYQYTGLTAEESIANWKSTVHPDDVQRVLTTWEQALTTGADYSLELRYRRYDGEYRWFQSRATPEQDENGNINAWYGVSTDIHDRVENEAELQEMINHTPFMLTRCTRDLRYRFVSRAYAEMIGRTPEEIAGKPIVEFMGEAGLNTILPYIEQVLQGRQVEYERDVPFRDRSTPALHMVYMPDYDAQGQVIGWFASIMDLTERQRTEDALRESEERYRRIVETANEGIWEIDKDTRTVFVNRRMAEMLGYTPEEMIGRSSFEFIVPEDYSEGAQRLERAKQGVSAPTSELRYRRKDGSLVWMIASSAPQFDEQGNFIGGVAMLTDITERKKTEDQLRELSQRLTYHVDNSPLAVIEWGPDMRLSRWSGTAERIFGWKAEEVLGKRMEDFPWIFTDDIQQVHDVSTELQTGSNIHRVSANRNYRKDGSVAYCEWYNSSLMDESGKLHSILSLVLDVTDRQQGENALVEYGRQQSALYKLVDQLHRADTMEAVFNSSLEALSSALQCDRASILLFDETKTMHFIAWRGLSEEYRKATDGHSPWNYGEENPAPIWYDDVTTSDLGDPLKAVIAKEGIRSLAFIPLVYQETLIGKLMVYFNTPHAFTQAEINLSLTIGRQLASGIDRKRAEERLRASEDRLRLAVAAGKIGIWDIDLVSRSRAWSKEGKQIYGLSEDEHLDFERQLELTHPDDRAYVDQSVRAFRDEGRVRQLNLEHRILHADGSVHWVEVQGEAVYEDKPLPVRLIGTIVDITERKHNEQELKDARGRAERTADRMTKLQAITATLSGKLTPKEIAEIAVTQGINMFRAASSTMMILSVDGEFLEILYSTAGDAITSPYKRFPVSTRIPAADALRLGDTIWIESRQQYLADYPHLAEEINRWNRQAAISIPMEYGGRILGIFLLSFDQPRKYDPEDEKYLLTLTQQATQALERTRAEASLRESEERYRALVNQATAGIVRKDANGRLIFVNNAFCEMLGYTASELSEKTMWEIVHPEDVWENRRLYNRLMTEGVPFQLEKRIIRHDGSILWTTVSVSPVLDAEGTPESAVSVYADITERKLAEGRLRLLAEVSDLTRNIEDPVELMASVAATVGSYFRAKRCLFNEIDTENNQEIVHRDYHAGVESVAGIHKLSDYSSVTTAEMAAGKIIVNFDSKTDPRTADDYERSYVPTGERAYVAIPLLREERWVASLWISDDKPRHWNDEEVALLAMIAERTWTATEKLRINAVLLENQQRLALTYEHAPMGIIETSADGKYVRVNEEFCKLTGYTKEELLELGINDLTYSEDHQSDEQLYERLFAGEIPFYRIEKRYRRKDGSLLWAELVRSMIYDENRIPMYSIGAVFNITERKLVEEELRQLNLELEDRVRQRTAELEAANEFLRESEATSRLILESMPDAILIADKKGQIVYGNTQVQNLFGYSAQEVIGQPVEMLIPQRFQVKHIGNRTDFRQDPHRRYMGLDRDLLGQRKDRSEFPVDVMLSPISNNTNWDVMVTIRDSTEQKEAQEALRANEEKLRKLFQVLPVGISFLDQDGKITEMNSALTEILGLSKHELLDGRFRKRRYIRSDGSAMPPSEFASVRAHEEQRPIYNVETGIVKENGETQWTSVNAAPVDVAEVDVVVATIDITERKKAEEALHKHRERLRVLSRRLVEVQEEERRAIARELHDRVGQNLAALNLNLNILRGQLTSTALLEVGQRLSDSVNLVNQILTITRNVMGDLRSDVLDDYGLEAAIREYAEKFSVRTGVQVVFNRSEKSVPRMDPSIEMTMLRIAQEALTNVAKHAQAKQATISVSADNEAVYMSVQDDGIGILSWQRANQPGSHGLRIIRERAEAFGGSLQVQSTYKKGTRIDVKIPLANFTQSRVSREKRS